MGPWIHEAPARTDWSGGALTESRASSHSARNPGNFLRSSLTSPRYLVILKLALHLSSQKLSDHSLPALQLPHSLRQPPGSGSWSCHYRTLAQHILLPEALHPRTVHGPFSGDFSSFSSIAAISRTVPPGFSFSYSFVFFFFFL